MKFFLSTIFISGLLIFSSCGNNGGNNPDDGGIMTDTANHKKPDADSTAKADSTVTAAYHLAKQDSARIADSIARTKNPVRDFN